MGYWLPMATVRNSPATKAKPLRERKRQNEVLEAAAKLFHEHGYSDTTVQDVADALGMLKGSLYYYIDTKEDLLFQLLVQVHDEVDELLEEVKAMPGLTPLQRLETYVRRLASYNLNNLVRITVYYHDVDRLSEERRSVILARRKSENQFVVRLIRQAQEDGDADDSMDANILTNFVFSAIIWSYRWYRPQTFDPEVVADQCAKFAIGGITGFL
jgi:TetR/AcrR family transcriptional regulator, cholesterol catabolism regulator